MLYSGSSSVIRTRNNNSPKSDNHTKAVVLDDFWEEIIYYPTGSMAKSPFVSGYAYFSIAPIPMVFSNGTYTSGSILRNREITPENNPEMNSESPTKWFKCREYQELTLKKISPNKYQLLLEGEILHEGSKNKCTQKAREVLETKKSESKRKELRELLRIKYGY